MNQHICYFETTVHHTFEDRGSNKDISNAPYMGDHKSFLGRGYYFWENNLQLGKHWGHKWFNDYMVAEWELKCDKNIFFDLVGDRSHQKFLVNFRKQFAGKRPTKADWPIGKLIELLKGLSKDPDGAYFNKFNFKVLRAVDIDHQAYANQVQFTEERLNSTDLNPCYIICVTDQKEIVLSKFSLVHRSKQAN